jgi:hypothetical protein
VIAVTRLALGLAICGCAAGCAAADSQRRLRTAVDARQASLDDCYAKALAHDRTADGAMKVWLHIAENADRVDAVEIESSKIANKRLHKCVRAALLNLDIGEAADGDLRVQYTLAFEPEADE